MGFMDDLKSRASKLQDNLKDNIKKFKNKDFMEAVVAGCALVAYADGVIKPEEKNKMLRFIQQSDDLKMFDMNQVIESFQKQIQKFDFDVNIGKGEALKAIGKLAKKPEEAKMMVWVCCAIGAADGNFDDTEKQVVREICQTLTLDPKEFQL